MSLIYNEEIAITDSYFQISSQNVQLEVNALTEGFTFEALGIPFALYNMSADVYGLFDAVTPRRGCDVTATPKRRKKKLCPRQIMRVQPHRRCKFT